MSVENGVIILKPEFEMLTQAADDENREEEKAVRPDFSRFKQICHNLFPKVIMLSGREPHTHISLPNVTQFPSPEVHLNRTCLPVYKVQVCGNMINIGAICKLLCVIIGVICG